MDRLTADTLPDRISDVAQLEDLLTQPSQALVDDMARLEGDLLVLGVGGKMGPTLARLARGPPREARHRRCAFQRAGTARELEQSGVETITADLLDGGGQALPKLRT